MGYSNNLYYGVVLSISDQKKIYVKKTKEVNVDSNGKEYDMSIKYSPENGDKLRIKTIDYEEYEPLYTLTDILHDLELENDFYSCEFYGDLADIYINEDILFYNGNKYRLNFGFQKNRVDHAPLIKQFKKEYKDLISELKKLYKSVEVKVIIIDYSL